MQIYVILGIDSTYTYDNRADAFERAWRESYNRFGSPVDIWEDMNNGDRSYILATIIANRRKI